jgi:hypothetical protein
MRLAKKIFFLSLLLAAFLSPAAGRADVNIGLTVTPAVIDIPTCEKGQICLEKTIAIKNNSAFRADVYAQVNDLSPTTGLIPYRDPSELPADASLVRWIDFYRSMITIQPGGTATQTLRITASPHAEPGKYHAIISFPTGNNLPEAQASDQQRNEAKLQINLDLVEHQIEQAEINRFAPSHAFFTDNSIGFVLKIKNIGNQPVAPAGDISIYDKGGREIDSLPITSSSIAPGEIKDFSTGAKLNLGPGKFKAIVNLNYGQDNGKNLTDIIYFSYLPLVLFIIFLLIIFGLLATVAFYYHKKRKTRQPPPVEEDKNLRYRSGSAPHPAVHHRYVVDLKKKEK